MPMTRSRGNRSTSHHGTRLGHGARRVETDDDQFRRYLTLARLLGTLLHDLVMFHLDQNRLDSCRFAHARCDYDNVEFGAVSASSPDQTPSLRAHPNR